MTRTTAFALCALVLATSYAEAHTYLIKPRPRQSWKYGVGDELKDGTGNGQSLCHLDGYTPTCCVSDRIPQMETYQRGDSIDTHWWRNNHVGGFIRYSIVPIADSDSQDAFDSAENMINYECNQVTCTETYGGSSPNNWNGGDAHGNLGWSNICSGAFKVPFHLKDGTYTMQWVWFGQGNGNKANSPFQSCVDIVIKGGPTGEKPKCPLWKGGDMSEAGPNVCTFVSVDNPTYQDVCKDANACSGAYTVGLPAGLDQCVNKGNAPSTYPLSMVASKGAPNTFDSYSASRTANSKSSSSSSSSDDSSNASSNSSSSSSNTKTSKNNSSSKKCSKKSRGQDKRRHYGKRSPVRRHGLDFAYAS